MPTEAGRVLDGKYLVQDLAGGGRFGHVHRAVHVALQKPVAVKVLHAGDRIAARDFARFRTEAEALGRLSHPHIVDVIDFGVDPDGGGTPFLVMELIEGETLEQILAREGRLDLSRAAVWLEQVASAVDYAHAQGVAHGDLTSRNIVVSTADTGRVVKVIDFGLAHLAEAATGESMSDAERRGAALLDTRITCTPEYAAPERLRGEPPTPASDTYAFTVLAYRLLTGRHPFEGDARTVVHAQRTQSAPAASLINSHLPSSLDEVLGGGLSKSPAARPPRAAAIARAVTAASREVARTRWRRNEAPRRVAVALAIGASLAAAGPPLAALAVVQRMEGTTQDLRFALMPPRAPDQRLLLVSIDDESLADDPRPLPLRGDEMADVIERAFAAGASVVAVDLLLPEAWASSRRFGEVLLTRAGRIVLAVAADATSVVGTEAVDPLVAAALGPAAASGLFGLVTVPAAPDGIVRHVPTTLLDARGQPRPTFAGRVAMLADGRVRATADAGVLIDYAVDGARFARMGWRAFDAALDAGTRFDDRVLLVGGEFTGSGDRHRIPGPRRLVADVSGLTLQAVIVDGLLQQRWLEAPPAWSIWLVVGAAVSASVLAALWVRRAAAVLATVTALILAATAASVLLLRVGVVVPLAAPAALLGVALGAALVLRGRMTKCPE